jgi:indole-3-glycerol phosphate synthase
VSAGSTPSVLARIVQSTRAELVRRKREVPQVALEDGLARRLADGSHDLRPRGFRAALGGTEIAVIAEFKRRSPSAGALREGAELEQVAGAYERGGASAMSVLTEGPNFGGSLSDLQSARLLCELPLLRKDFVVEEYQLLEARTAGADAVLLIVAALSQGELTSLHARAHELGLDVLVEVHDRREVEVALALGAQLIGVNNRDLRDFSVDIARTSLLREAIPRGIAVVSESGISTPEQLRSLEGEGVDAVLVGEALMRASDPARALCALRGKQPQEDLGTGGTAAGEDPVAESETVKLPSAQF